MLAGTVNEIYPNEEDEQTEDQAQLRSSEAVGKVSAKPGANKHRDGKDNSRMDINIAVTVVLECCGKANGRQKDGQTRTSGIVLREACKINESRNNYYAATYTEHAGYKSTKYSDDNESEP